MKHILIQLGIYDSIIVALVYLIHNAHYGIAILIGLSTLYFNILKIKNQKLQNQKLKNEKDITSI